MVCGVTGLSLKNPLSSRVRDVINPCHLWLQVTIPRKTSLLLFRAAGHSILKEVLSQDLEPWFSWQHTQFIVPRVTYVGALYADPKLFSKKL